MLNRYTRFRNSLNTPALIASGNVLTSAYERLKASIAESLPSTAEHSVRVRICATKIGFACCLSGAEMTTLSVASEIHDIGKIRIPQTILEKKDPLTETEWSIIKQHPIWGARMAASAFPNCPDVAKGVIAHHERLDGSGYPCGLMAEQIPIIPRIIAIADAFIALTENRKYRPAYEPKRAFRILSEDESGKHDESLLAVLSRLT